MFDRIIPYLFYFLFLLTPLFWTSQNYELFEYNKMLLTYGFTALIAGAWLLKMIQEKSFIFKRTPLDLPLLLFLGANIISSIFSIDPHTSIWGYYSRSNGGLLSTVAYLLLYWAFVSNMKKEHIKPLLQMGLASAFFISLWAIFEHFGVSPSCLILRGELNAGCWVQDVQARVFATLGQPNWLAVYLSMLIFPALYLFLTSTAQKEKIVYFVSLVAMYLAFTFTYSRGPTLGLIAGMVVFIVGYIFCHSEPKAKNIIISFPRIKSGVRMTKLVGILASFLLINLLFGSALTSFRLVSQFASPARPAISLPVTPSGTQLENGGTESGQIRFIVWKGAWEIFKHYPIFGSGLETFAYSYYQFRPQSHNLTSEWDFLYNKAHNEYLNYLATTGLVGLLTYIGVIGTFIGWCLKLTKDVILNTFASLSVNSVKNIKKLYPSLIAQDDKIILVIALLSSYVSYLIYNFFLFSVVIIAIFFYLFPALIFVATESVKDVKKVPSILSALYALLPIYRSPLYTKAAKGLAILVTFYLIFSIFQLWYADTQFNRGDKASDAGSPGVAYNLLTQAVELNKAEPLYKSELAYAAAAASSALTEVDATLSAALKDEALAQMEQTLSMSPKNVSLWRTAIRTYFELATTDQQYLELTLQSLDSTIKLAPTDPKLYYNKALVLAALNRKDEEIAALQKAIQLKPNYLEALEQLKEATSGAKP